MRMRVAAVILGLMLAGLPAMASVATAAHKTAHRAPARKPDKKASGAITSAYAAMPEADRLAIQADLAWLGYYDGVPGGEFDERTIDAVKLFQKAIGDKESGILSEPERTRLAAATRGPQAAVGWRLTDDPPTEARLGIPEKLVSPKGPSRIGSRWSSGHGQIQIETFRLREASLAALFEEEKKTPRRRGVEWSVLKSDSFVISGFQGLKRFIVRAVAASGEVRGITILYDQATEGIMGRVAVAAANTFQGFPDPTSASPPGYKRSVEYGTAIVVDRNGHLLTLGELADQCQAITVPGFGHAERIAEDKTNHLALLRLYGAHNLAPAALGGESATVDDKSGDLTLVGIADPLAQNGGDAVSRVAAHLTAQGVEPAPKPGFCGAAAVDPQGRFAGMVELKSTAVAGIGPAALQATLVPADAVRSFLTANRITPASGHTPIEQSVVRVICVRK